MPRWFVALVLSLMLPCYAFTAVAQTLAVVSKDGSHIDTDLLDEAKPTTGSGFIGCDSDDDEGLHVDPDTPSDPGLFDGARDEFLDIDPAAALSRFRPTPQAPPFLEGLRRPPRRAGIPC